MKCVSIARRSQPLEILVLMLATLLGCQGADPFYRRANLGGGSGGQAGDAAHGRAPEASDGGLDRAGTDRMLFQAVNDAAGTVDAKMDGSANAGDDASDGDASADGSEANCGPCALGVLYMCEGTAANTIRATFKLVNDTGVPIHLHEVAIRYWFTAGAGGSPWVFACDNGMLGIVTGSGDITASVTGVFKPVSPARPGADTYFEVGFADGAGDLLPGQASLFRTRVFRQDYTTIAQTDDYSFNARNTSFAPSPHITLYRNGALIEGVEPPSP